MKKVFFAAVAVLALASCKKNWTCQCYDYGYSSEYTHEYTIVNKTKRNATNICEDKVAVGLVTVGGNSNCSLK